MNQECLLIHVMKLSNKDFNNIVAAVVSVINDRFIITPKHLPIHVGLSDDKLLDLILNMVCEHYGISLEKIKSRRRNLENVVPRQIYMWLAKEFKTKTMSDAMIATKINLTRCNAINQPKNLENILQVDKQLFAVAMALRLEVNKKIEFHNFAPQNEN